MPAAPSRCAGPPTAAFLTPDSLLIWFSHLIRPPTPTRRAPVANQTSGDSNGQTGQHCPRPDSARTGGGSRRRSAGRIAQGHRPRPENRPDARPGPQPRSTGQLTVSAEQEPFDGDARLFRLGVEAHRLGLAYEYDPFFSLSIARVDPLPAPARSGLRLLPAAARASASCWPTIPGPARRSWRGCCSRSSRPAALCAAMLIVTPANLTFQWQRELADKFREKFDVIRGDVLAANYGQNPWQERDQVITSVSWVSLVEDARESLLRSRWDLVIVDEAHKMSAPVEDHKTYAYRLGESLSKMTDHFLLMTATPHKGDQDHFRRFLALLDPDVYGSIQSLQQAMREHEAPFYLRRTKEALVTFPASRTRARSDKLFTKREVRTAAFDLDGDELDFYDELTRYVEDQSMAAAGDESARGRAVGFTMAMLQRRMASSVYAVRRSLERMRDRREKILEDPEAYRQQQIERRLPDDFDDLTEEEQQRIIGQLEGEVLSADPAVLREEIGRLARLIDQAKGLEGRDVQSKLTKLRAVLTEQGIFGDPKMKLLDLHRAQGHARLPGRRWPRRPPARQAARVGPDAHADPRRHEDRRPRHAGQPHLCRARVQGIRPGPGRHRGRRRRHQPAILLADDQLRHSLEPRPPGAARRPHPPLRPGDTTA